MNHTVIEKSVIVRPIAAVPLRFGFSKLSTKMAATAMLLAIILLGLMMHRSSHGSELELSPSTTSKQEPAQATKTDATSSLTDPREQTNASAARPAPEVTIQGEARRVVRFTPSPAALSASLGTPIPAANEPSSAPAIRMDELQSFENAPAIRVDALSQPASVDRPGPPPPSYLLLSELPPPQPRAERHADSPKRVVSMPPPSGLPIEPWSSPTDLETPTYRVAELKLPDAYRKLMETTELQLSPSGLGESSTPQDPASELKRNVVSIRKPLEWQTPEILEVNPDNARLPDGGNARPKHLLTSEDEKRDQSGLDNLQLDSADSREERGPYFTQTRRDELLDKHSKELQKQRDLVEKMINSISRDKREAADIKPTLNPTWVAETRFPLLRYTGQSELSLVEAIHTAIQFAPEIEVLRTQVGIDRAEVIKQQAGFDWNQFVDANWDERNVPVASDLDGVANRLESHTLASSFGLERLNQLGGQFRLAQDLGLADSNSQFFNPQNQASATIALEYQQPLLQGAGLFVNTSLINIAVANANASQEDFVAGLQTHILDVATAYWDLVARRGEFVIQKRSYERALEVAKIVANRSHLDVNPVQSARAEATLGARRTALLQSEYAVVFAQEQLLRLVFGQCFEQSVDREIIPTSDMLGPIRQVDLDMEVQVALQQRPEIRRALQLIKRTSIEQGVAKNQLLPLLGLSLSVSNQGLRGNRGLASAIDDQWNLGDPTYGIGLSYAFPVGNRAARANLRQADLRLRQFQKQFEQVLSDVALEVRNASNSIALSGQQRVATANALALADKELRILETRAELLLDGDEVGPLYLDNLLQTQDRLAAAELGYLSASTVYAQSHFELQRANGGLLRCSPLPVEAAPTKTWQHRLAGQTTAIPPQAVMQPPHANSMHPPGFVPGQVPMQRQPAYPTAPHIIPGPQMQPAPQFQPGLQTPASPQNPSPIRVPPVVQQGTPVPTFTAQQFHHLPPR
ncbi:MAG: TolC family protein [Aureliella sp.]